jgi:hypothetical protein
MVAPETSDNGSLRIELQEALVTYRQWATQLTQVAGFFVAADVVLVSYGFSQRLAAILLVASTVPMLILVMYMAIGSVNRPLVNLVLRIERKLLIQEDSLGAILAQTWLKWESLWSTVPITLYTATAVQVGLFVLSLTVFHYRFM